MLGNGMLSMVVGVVFITYMLTPSLNVIFLIVLCRSLPGYFMEINILEISIFKTQPCVFFVSFLLALCHVAPLSFDGIITYSVTVARNL